MEYFLIFNVCTVLLHVLKLVLKINWAKIIYCQLINHYDTNNSCPLIKPLTGKNHSKVYIKTIKLIIAKRTDLWELNQII